MHKKIVSNSNDYHKVHDNFVHEAMVNQPFWMPFAFYLPIGVFFLFKSFVIKRVSILHLIWMLPLIAKFWGYLEFFLHKNILHKNENIPLDFGLIQEFHDLHHQFPNDDFKISTPLWASIPSGIVFYTTCRTILGENKGDAMFGLLVLYYLFYEFSHISAHKMQIKHPFFEGIKKHHLKHHYQDSDKAFGFTTDDWDIKNNTSFEQKIRNVS
jgi:hypothetical protein